MTFTELAFPIFEQSIRDYHVHDNIDEPMVNPYEGIGRGNINIHGLPVYRDAEGGVGTPTSDHERTKMTSETRHLLVLINGYDGNEQRVRENAEYIQVLLRKYAQSDGGTYFIYR